MRESLIAVGVALVLSAFPCARTETSMLKLSCGSVAKNFLANDSKPEKIAGLGILVNLSEQTGSSFAHPARITQMSDVSAEFFGHFENNRSINGTIDHITSSIRATEVMMKAKSVTILNEGWDLTSAPTKRAL